MGQRGNSLIQVVIAAGIMGAIALAMATMLSNQRMEVKTISEKLLSQEIETQMRALFQSSDYCNCAFRGKTFDTSATPPTIASADQFTNLISGYSTGPMDVTPCTSNGFDLVGAAGSLITGTTMTVGAIGLGPMTQVSPGVYRADFQLDFANAVRAIKGARTSVQFAVDMAGGSGPTARPFTSCLNSIGAGGPTTKAYIGWGGPAYGGSWSGIRTMQIQANICHLAAYGNDQSGAGNSNCNTTRLAADDWQLQVTGNQGWVKCHWLCDDYKGTHSGTFDTFYTFQ